MKDNFQILVIEDQPKHQKIFAETLKFELEVDVRFALSGEEGLQMMAAEKRPDLVVLDLDLPTISGKEVLKQLKANIETRLIPVMVLTGSSSQLAELELLENGAEDYLEKGSHPDILVSRIRAQIRHKKAIDRMQNLAINRDIFAAGILANIRTIRKSLNDQAEQVKDSLLKDPVSELAKINATMDNMCAQASKLGQFANDVIQSVREARHSSHPRKVDLDEIVGQFAPIQVEGRASIQIQGKGKLGTVTIDQNYLRILIANLGQNAAKRSLKTEGLITIEIYAEPYLDRTIHGVSMRKFVISDTYGNVDQSMLTTLFEPMIVDADGEQTQSFDINLAVAKNVVQKMAGDIWAQKAEAKDEGIEFHIYLPS